MDHRVFLSIATLGLSAIAPIVLAAPQPQAVKASPAAAEIATVKVNGLVCDFCVETIRRMAKKEAAIAEAQVDLDRGVVVVTFKAGQTMTDAALKKFIAKAGYAVVGVERRKAGPA